MATKNDEPLGPCLSPASAEARAHLADDLLAEEAARRLRTEVDQQPAGSAPAALREVCDILDGGKPWSDSPPPGPVPTLDDSMHEELVLHPREKQGRQHWLASVISRIFHMLEGDPTAHTIAKVTEQPEPESLPSLFAEVGDCSKSLGIDPPAIHVTRGADKVFTVLMDKAPFLYIHQDFVDESGPPAKKDILLSRAQLRFAVAHQLEHVRGKHAALLQMSPERLEYLILSEVPFVFRAPVKLASKALGWTRVRGAFKKAAGWLSRKSRTGKVVDTIGEFFPDKDQETVLPQIVHGWVWSWIEGVEFSADRAGLLANGSLGGSVTALLRLSRAYSGDLPAIQQRGIRWLLRENSEPDRATANRLRELLRFAVSEAYIGYVVRGPSVSGFAPKSG